MALCMPKKITQSSEKKLFHIVTLTSIAPGAWTLQKEPTLHIIFDHSTDVSSSNLMILEADWKRKLLLRALVHLPQWDK